MHSHHYGAPNSKRVGWTAPSASPSPMPQRKRTNSSDSDDSEETLPTASPAVARSKSLGKLSPTSPSILRRDSKYCLPLRLSAPTLSPPSSGNLIGTRRQQPHWIYATKSSKGTSKKNAISIFLMVCILLSLTAYWYIETQLLHVVEETESFFRDNEELHYHLLQTTKEARVAFREIESTMKAFSAEMKEDHGLRASR